MVDNDFAVVAAVVASYDDDTSVLVLKIED